MRRSLQSAYAIAMLVAVLLPALPSRAETLAEIEGLSLVVDWTQRVTGQDPSGQYFTNDSHSTHRYYISSKGNVFDYPASSNPANRGPQVFAVGRTQDRGNGFTVSWSMTDGHLTTVLKYPQGSTDHILAIDPLHLTCALEIRHHYDPQTGLLTPQTPAGVFKLRAVETLTSSCAVKRGNIFAGD